MRLRVALTLIFLAWIICDAAPLRAQQESRADSLRAARRAKMHRLRPPPEPGSFERLLNRVQGSGTAGSSVGFYGFRPRLGGLDAGAGLSGGIRFAPFSPGDPIRLRADVLASTRRYWGVGMMGGFDDGSARLYGHARYVHRPGERFFGIGSDSERAAESDYRLDRFAAGATGSVTLDGAFAGVHSRYDDFRFRHGRNDDLPDAEPATLSGVDPAAAGSARYFSIAGTVGFDNRNPGGSDPTIRWSAPGTEDLVRLPLATDRGILLQAGIAHRLAMRDGSTDFTRITLQGQQHVSFRHGVNVFAFREYVALTYAGASGRVPFYLLPALGGPGTLRGYALHRFRDRHAILINAEYRWQIWLFADLALFADAGQVFDEFKDATLENFAASYGAGIRLRTATRGFFRLDFARSVEGIQLHLRLSSNI